jgi:hypothetical protein
MTAIATATPEPAPRGWLKRARGQFERQHDYLSATRQRSIADLALGMNLVIAVLYVLAVTYWDWHLDVSALAQWATIACWGAALLGMLAASSIPGGIRGFFDGIIERGTGRRRPEAQWVRNARKYLFYPAAYCNFAAAAIWIEVSGGVVESPFTPVLFAMILTAQQLSRFKLNSRLFLGFGVLATGVLAIYETVAGIHEAPTPPPKLAFWILVAAFVVTALCAHALKQHNYRAAKTYPDPEVVEVYKDSDQRWRYAISADQTPLDPVLGDGGLATVGAAKDAAKELLCGQCKEGQDDVQWEFDRPADEPAGRIVASRPNEH